MITGVAGGTFTDGCRGSDGMCERAGFFQRLLLGLGSLEVLDWRSDLTLGCNLAFFLIVCLFK